MYLSLALWDDDVVVHGCRLFEGVTKSTDLVLAVSSSTRVGVTNFIRLLDVARELVYGLNVDAAGADSSLGPPAGSQVAALSFADQPYIQFQLSSFSNQLDILNALSMAYQSVTPLVNDNNNKIVRPYSRLSTVRG